MENKKNDQNELRGYSGPIVRSNTFFAVPPKWAILERQLFEVIESSWPIFEKKYCNDDGSLVFDTTPWHSRDGADDFYEAFFNWPAFYMLGGSSEILTFSKKAWRGVTNQLTKMGLVKDDFEKGYDWFHQGESLIFFYSICAADPKDQIFKQLAKNFAELYCGENSLLYDKKNKVIPSPHSGSDGLRPGLGQEFLNGYPPTELHSIMKPYGLPLQYLPEINSYEDLLERDKAKFMAEEMERILGDGDVAVNLTATSLVTNYWLYDNDPAASEWVLEYLDAWVERANANDGIIPDNVSRDGVVGGLHDGRWYGGLYGWTWPHGFYSVSHSALVAASNAILIKRDYSALSMTRNVLKTVLSKSITSTIEKTPGSLTVSSSSTMSERLAIPRNATVNLVPYRYGKEGWFDFAPMIMCQPLWLWWLSLNKDDQMILEESLDGIDPHSTYISPARNKEEAGHESPWYRYLQGQLPDYPEDSLMMAIGQVYRRVKLMETEQVSGPAGINIHFWQEVQPVVTEILTQLTLGAPHVLYNGGLQFARIRYFDIDNKRIGLPLDVSALVTGFDQEQLTIELVNTSMQHVRNLVLLGGAFGEHEIIEVTVLEDSAQKQYPGVRNEYLAPKPNLIERTIDIKGNHFAVTLEPGNHLYLTLKMRFNSLNARFYTFEDFE